MTSAGPAGYDYYIDFVTSLNCYPQARQLLCGLLFPECREDVGFILPSKSVCEGFMAGCEDLLRVDEGSSNPLPIDCDNIPVNPDPVCYDQCKIFKNCP